MLSFPEYISLVKSGKAQLKSEDFFTSFGKRVFDTVMSMTDETGKFEIGMLGEVFNPDEMGRIFEMKLRRERLTYNGEDVLRDAIDRLKGEQGGSGGLDDIQKILDEKRRKAELDK